MNILHIVYVICGIFLGVFVTFRLRDAMNKELSTTAIKPTAKPSDGKSNLDLLLEEKQLLLSRLNEIDGELGTSSKTVLRTSSPSFPPTFSPTFAKLPLKSMPPTAAKEVPMEKVPEIPVIQEPPPSKREVQSKEVPPSSKCPYDFKVYVYEIPPELNAVRYSEEARRNLTLHVCQKCILEQFSLEYIVLDFFTQFCGRTYNPEEADYFYLPIVRDAEFRVAQSMGGRNRDPSNVEKALLAVMEKGDTGPWKEVFKVTDKHWLARGGGDHILAMPAPVTNLRHESSMRGYFHYMMHLHTPIFLNLEYSIGFVREYPVCATKKNMVVPYPTTDPDLYNGKLLADTKGVKVPRTSLVYYVGGMHGECIEVRKAMKVLMSNSTKLKNNIVPTFKSSMSDREHGFLAATFCPIPVGDSPSSKRMYDVINFGCIPVVLSDDLIWAFSDQSGGSLNHNDFSFQMPQSVVQFTAQKTLRRYASNKADLGVLPSGTLLYDLLEESVKEGGEYQEGRYVNPLVQILLKVPDRDVQTLRKGVERAAPLYRYYQMNSTLAMIPTSKHHFPNGGAIDMIAAGLSERKKYGLERLRDECKQEMSRKHKYVGRYACDPDKSESLVRRRRRLSEW